MAGPRRKMSRRAALGGGALALVGVASAEAQSDSARTGKFQAWVNHVRALQNVSPMTNGHLLDFPIEQVQRKQIGVTVNGVLRLFAVVVPYQRDGVVLAAGNSETRVFSVHRTGTHLRRVGSARNLGGRLSRWSGPACEEDFRAQIAFWLAQRIG